MREILFKAKRIDNGEWVEGWLLKDEITGQYFIHASGNSVNESDKVNEEGCLQFVAFEVDENTICQYTGLTDKNGNKIWENDICDRKEQFPEIVKYHEGDFVIDYSYALGKEEGDSYCNLGFYVCERESVKVIGNIFDNPELLEGTPVNGYADQCGLMSAT